mmetsp:Transcript_115909/g.322741  ORF Transcript_115909/g.322741 Transcript_115909/m.322741 type:complete len:254 (+) Transcript_115909:796-1557(+)
MALQPCVRCTATLQRGQNMTPSRRWSRRPRSCSRCSRAARKSSHSCWTPVHGPLHRWQYCAWQLSTRQPMGPGCCEKPPGGGCTTPLQPASPHMMPTRPPFFHSLSWSYLARALPSASHAAKMSKSSISCGTLLPRSAAGHVPPKSRTLRFAQSQQTLCEQQPNSSLRRMGHSHDSRPHELHSHLSSSAVRSASSTSKSEKHERSEHSVVEAGLASEHSVAEAGLAFETTNCNSGVSWLLLSLLAVACKSLSV